MLLQSHELWFSAKCSLSNTQKKIKKKKKRQYREDKTTSVQASTIQPWWAFMAHSSVYLIGHSDSLLGPFMLRRGRAVCDPSLLNCSHLLLLHYVKCKSAPCSMLLYLLAIRTDYHSENTTSDVRQEDCFSLCSAVYLPGNTSCYKS